jgi:heavy metal efflux system protein
MISYLVSFALRQRFLIVIASLMLMIWGAFSFQKLPIDAYPDLSPPHVEIISQWPGHAAEEVERLVSIPLEIEMNGIPKLESLRSISLYGLSSVQMNFDYTADPYFVREQAFERVGNATLPNGVTPNMSPLYSPSGLIYRYVLQSPDRTPQDLKTIEDWVLERQYCMVVPPKPESSATPWMERYQVLLDPNKLFSYNVTVPQISQQLGNNNGNAGGGFYSQGGQFYYVRGLGLVRNTEDIGNVIVAEKGGIPVHVKDLAQVTIGHAPRLGQFGYMKQEEAVEGVILMRVGEQAQMILKRVEDMTKNLNEHVLPPDVKVIPYYDRQFLIQETTETVEGNLVRGMLLVLLILGMFLFSVRTALIVAVTIPFALLFSFICLDWRHIPANLLSIGAIDFGIIVDGAVVMVENIFRELAIRERDAGTMEVIRAAARDVERPIFYAIAVIIAGYIPIYVLQGPSGRLFQPMADTMSFALLGSLLCALTLLPVLCSYVLRHTIHEPHVVVYEWIRAVYGRMLGWCLRNRTATVLLVLSVFAGSLMLIPGIGGEFMPHLDEGALWVRATTPYTISFEEASKLSPQICDILMSFPQVTTVANELGRPDDGTDGEQQRDSAAALQVEIPGAVGEDPRYHVVRLSARRRLAARLPNRPERLPSGASELPQSGGSIHGGGEPVEPGGGAGSYSVRRDHISTRRRGGAEQARRKIRRQFLRVFSASLRLRVEFPLPVLFWSQCPTRTPSKIHCDLSGVCRNAQLSSSAPMAISRSAS